jgi:hypothetical protein
MKRVVLGIAALALTGCASLATKGAPTTRLLREGEVCGTDSVMGPSPTDAKCGPRLVCAAWDAISSPSASGRLVRRCESVPFFGGRGVGGSWR